MVSDSATPTRHHTGKDPGAAPSAPGSAILPPDLPAVPPRLRRPAILLEDGPARRDHGGHRGPAAGPRLRRELRAWAPRPGSSPRWWPGWSPPSWAARTSRSPAPPAPWWWSWPRWSPPTASAASPWSRCWPGCWSCLLGISGLGRAVAFIPWPVVEGFTLGIAAIIFLQQVPMATGTEGTPGHNTLLAAVESASRATSPTVLQTLGGGGGRRGRDVPAPQAAQVPARKPDRGAAGHRGGRAARPGHPPDRRAAAFPAGALDALPRSGRAGRAADARRVHRDAGRHRIPALGPGGRRHGRPGRPAHRRLQPGPRAHRAGAGLDRRRVLRRHARHRRDRPDRRQRPLRRQDPALRDRARPGAAGHHLPGGRAGRQDPAGGPGRHPDGHGHTHGLDGTR